MYSNYLAKVLCLDKVILSKMNQEQILQACRDYIHNHFSGEGTGHDFFHVERVVKTARKIAEIEKVDLFLVEIAAWLHDTGDYKLHGGKDKSEELISEFLTSLNLETELIAKVIEIVSQVSFSKGNLATTKEAQIVQDADRLDALGAIGIARCFAYGGKKQREIWNPDNPEATSLQHFYDKLLKLKDLMNTSSAQEIAEERHRFLNEFLTQFYKEWEGS